MTSGTVHVIATSLDGTREALEAATVFARGLSGRVVVFVPRASSNVRSPQRDTTADRAEAALRGLADSCTPRPSVLSCVCEHAIDVVQLIRSQLPVFIGGEARMWWPTAEQRLARALTRLGCHVMFVHVPRGHFVSALVTPTREQELKTQHVSEPAETS
jgi:hypothetical protein